MYVAMTGYSPRAVHVYVIEQAPDVVAQLPIDVPPTANATVPAGLPDPLTVAVSVTAVLMTTGEAEVVIVVVVGLAAANAAIGLTSPRIAAAIEMIEIFFTMLLRYPVRYTGNDSEH